MGPVAGVLGLAVGFGANYLQAMYAKNRLILDNGSNRAYALCDMGINHVPCVVQHVSRREELGLIVASTFSNIPTSTWLHRVLRYSRITLTRSCANLLPFTEICARSS